MYFISTTIRPVRKISPLQGDGNNGTMVYDRGACDRKEDKSPARGRKRLTLLRIAVKKRVRKISPLQGDGNQTYQPF